MSEMQTAEGAHSRSASKVEICCIAFYYLVKVDFVDTSWCIYQYILLPVPM